MKTPPLLLGAALIFWGWQSGFLIPGAVMAVVLESARLIRPRWELSDDDFSRIWTFCTVLFLAGAVYAFTANEGPSHFGRFFQNPNPSTQSGMGVAGARTAAAFFRWLPMILYLFVAAQAFSAREEIPLYTVSLFLRRRWKNAIQAGITPLPARSFNAAFPFLAICLFSAANHSSDNNSYFWGLCGLLAWTLWTQRSRRFGMAVWAGTFMAAAVLGYEGQRGIGRLQTYIESMNPQWLANWLQRGFDPARSKLSLGKIGAQKSSSHIVVRLEPIAGNAPNYLREASYQHYGAETWYVGTNTFESINPETNETSWVLLPGKTNRAVARIAAYLDDRSRETGQRTGLLPLPTGCGRLDNLPAYPVQVNTLGAVLAEGPGLVVFDAAFGPGATIDSEPHRPGDFEVPPREKPALDQLISGLPVTNGNPAEVLRAVNAMFQSRFSYSTWQPRPKTVLTNETPLSRFLLQTHSGHCEYFATATVLLLRELNIPARYAVGYVVHETSGRGYVVRERDAHAWCVVWDAQSKTWRDFDTTPASWVEQEAKPVSIFQRFSDFRSWLWFQISKFRWGQTHLREYLLVALVPVLALLLYQIVFRRKRKGKGRRCSAVGTEQRLPGWDSEFYLIEKALSARGFARRPEEAFTDWLHRAATGHLPADLSEAVRSLLRLHYRYRFDPAGLDAAGREQLRREARACLDRLMAIPNARINRSFS